jgi:hypothetical protein
MIDVTYFAATPSSDFPPVLAVGLPLIALIGFIVTFYFRRKK